MLTIERVAIEFSDVTMSLPPPNRHHDLIRWHGMITGKFGSGRRQGFITSSGAFVDRRKAAVIAYAAGQIKEPKKMLFSEDLW